MKESIQEEEDQAIAQIGERALLTRVIEITETGIGETKTQKVLLRSISLN